MNSTIEKENVRFNTNTVYEIFLEGLGILDFYIILFRDCIHYSKWLMALANSWFGASLDKDCPIMSLARLSTLFMLTTLNIYLCCARYILLRTYSSKFNN